MKNESNNLDNNTNNETDNIIKNTAIDAANTEKAGAILLSLGYATFIKASNIDILEALDANTTGITSFDILTFGQRLTLLGYILLYIAARKRLNEKALANLFNCEENNLLAFEILKNSYLGSIIVNCIRLIQFSKLLNQ